MYKLFDKILAKRINDVFQNHQETYNPDDWKKLQAKMRKPKKGLVIIMPHIAKAASIILFIGLSVFVVNKYDENHVSIYDRSNVNENTTSENENKLIQNNEIGISSENDSLKNVFEKNRSQSFQENMDLEHENNVIEDQYVYNELPLTDDYENERFDNVKNELEEYSTDIKGMEKKQKNTNKDSYIADSDEFDELEEKNKHENHFAFGIELASVSNFSDEANTNGINVGGGISASYKISKKLSLTTGLLVAKQSVNYDGSINVTNKNSLSVIPYRETASYSTEMIDVASTKSEVSFVAVDIPLNVQFKHKRVSFSTGVSSLLYIQERFSYSYETSVTNTFYDSKNNSYNTVGTKEKVSEEETYGSFDRFDFARLLNFSIGYEIPFSKSNLIVEPYLKYPLGSLSSKEISIGSGGLALKYVF